MQIPELKEDASNTALNIAAKVKGRRNEVREVLQQAGLN